MVKIVPADFEDYARHFPEDVQTALRLVRSTVKKAIPRAQETIGYNLPAFAVDGKVLVWFAAFKKHVGFYPGAAAIKRFASELSGYKSAKGSVQFPLDRPMPVDLIARIAKYRAGL